MDFKAAVWVKYDIPVFIDSASDSGLATDDEFVLAGARSFFQNGFSCRQSMVTHIHMIFL